LGERSGDGTRIGARSSAPFQGVRQPGRGVDYTPPSSNDVKERVQPYLWALMARYIGIFTFTFTYTIATLDPLLIYGRVKG